MSTLDIRDLQASHGQLRAVHGVSLSVKPGEMLFVLGANGAGKTTLLRSIAGDHRAEAGSVRLSGVDITGLAAHHRARSGLALVPEGRRLFPNMTVRENLALGRSTSREGPWTIEAIYEAFPNLAKLDHAPAGKLSGGEQQAVAIGRALMGDPVAIILDEVSLGLSPAAVDFAYDALKRVRDMGIALLVVEQDLNRALHTADDLMVMCEGHVTLHATPARTSLNALAAASFGHDEGETA
ncbi:LIV-I protein F [Thalassovita gelatinovora]|uniref:LIV-I protein F n=1 Tax=Thalassovita gelatinovora TaxID=53501 RepID=A0A0N7LUF9_THAGE|nr:ABC transporter ATP-binding protein [Thalassovita gelatinovora]QIZ80904.1 ABC transporter ATP-binding protein [Thalassovita gelatinovora]CUH63386.1 LIV-I protein F [Thalassovita gelatinovora]SEQ66193.1 amino acid/amide ABC transporter ATP-binding protein 2, HAAT family [Thalassovita gelatinovora]